MDDISALRQVSGEVLQADAWLFRPADAINVIPGDDNGTPLQRDEPQALNPPDGAFIDYYLKAGTGAVTLEILDAAGKILRKWPPPRRTGGGGAKRARGEWAAARVATVAAPAGDVLDGGPGCTEWCGGRSHPPSPVDRGAARARGSPVPSRLA